MTSLWRNALPLILASKSQARQALLTAAGLPYEAIGADVDERAVEEPLVAKGASGSEVATHLARAKALAVSTQKPGYLVIGADQVLQLEKRLFSKPRDLDEAKEHLAALSGKTHELHSAFCVIRDGRIVGEDVAIARIACRVLSSDFIDAYVALAGESLLSSVGAGAIEGLGIHTIAAIEGDHSTIMGLPLLPLFEILRRDGSLIS